MLHIYSGDLETGANEQHDEAAHQDDQLQRRASAGNQLSLPLYHPRNRSTGNLAVAADTPDKARLRLSFDAGAAATEPDAVGRSPIMTDHDHGLGLSGLRRIRQHPPARAPTLPSNSSSSRSALPRSVSMISIPQQAFASSSGPMSPSFIDDLTRFPSESLHSFSFAHQSDDLMYNRQNVLKRSVEFMKDRAARSVSASNPGGVGATGLSRASGDIEIQNMLEMLAQARPGEAAGLLSGPSEGENIFDKSFIPRSMSPEPLSATSPSSHTGSPVLIRHVDGHDTVVPDGLELKQHASNQPRDSAKLVSIPDSRTAVATASTAPSIAVPPTQMSTNLSNCNSQNLQNAVAHTNNIDRTDISNSPNSNTTPTDQAAGVTSDSADSSRTPTNESGTTQQTSPPQTRPPSLLLKRMATAPAHSSTQQRLMDSLATPGTSGSAATSPQILAMQSSGTSPSASQRSLASPLSLSGNLTNVHSHATRWVPAAQAIFTTEAKPPWTIIAANDLACLVFGVTKAEVRKMGLLEVVQEERRAWLEKKLLYGDTDDSEHLASTAVIQPSPQPTNRTSVLLGSRSGGITAKLLSKPNSRTQTPTPRSSGSSSSSSPFPTVQQLAQRRASTVHGSGSKSAKPLGNGHHHYGTKSRGVLLCGDVVPIRKRNGATGSASLWVKEKRIGLIWVLEEIHEDVATVTVDNEGIVTGLDGALGPIWGDASLSPGMEVGKLLPRVPRLGIKPWSGPVDFNEVVKKRYYTCRNSDRINIPATIDQLRGQSALRVSSFPHIAGIVVVSTTTLAIKSSNSVFCGALFGYEKPNGLSINQLLPDFDQILRILIEVDGVHVSDGVVVPEHSFRKASAFLALREGRPDATTAFLRPEGLTARHRDGSELKIDVQMRVVKSEKQGQVRDEAVLETDEDTADTAASSVTGDSNSSNNYTQTEMVYALWITYARHLHATRSNLGVASPLLSGTATPLHQPSPGQTPVHSPPEFSPGMTTGESVHSPADNERTEAAQSLTQKLKDVATAPAPGPPKVTGIAPPPTSNPEGKSISSRIAIGSSTPAVAPALTVTSSSSATTSPDLSKSPSSTKSDLAARDANAHKKTINDFIILEDMGQGAYGQVKLAKNKTNGKVMVIKYVTKKRILVDTWTRDRRLGTVPLEIHVLDFLRRNNLRHNNIVDMEDFFEDDTNYYIEMVPHGLPGMDLFDYIELRSNMEEEECRSLFTQSAKAIHHLHTKAKVVHRDIKDENIILDGEGVIKLIDFGSAAYIKSGPFDVFVGTIDYAAPEVLAGQPYGGKEQDVWALGILLYTIIYKENPFYSIDEIMDRDLRVPYVVSEDSIDLIRRMLNRNVAERYTIEQVLDHPWCSID